MRSTFALSVLALLVSLHQPLPAGAAELAATESVEEVELRGITGDACYGDRYESDDDLNDGNRITDEEIRQLLNPAHS